MTPEQTRTLQAVWESYQRWMETSGALEEQMAAAAAAESVPPVDAMQTDFVAQIAVSRAVIAFAAACPLEGPDLAGRPGAAVVQSIFQAATPELSVELDALERQWPGWLPTVRAWTPAKGPPPVPPVSPHHSHVLATVDTWGEFEHDAMRDKVVGMLAGAGGQRVSETVGVNDDGQIVEVTRFHFDPPPAIQRRGSVFGRLRAWLRRGGS